MSKFTDAIASWNPENADKNTAPAGVQRSLWSALKRAGMAPAAAGTVSWTLLKAARPSMRGHAEALRDLSQLGPLRANAINAVAYVMNGETTRKSPARLEIVSRIIEALKGTPEVQIDNVTGEVTELAPNVKAQP